MNIYIPTRGRAHFQRTLKYLPAALHPYTKLVVNHDEASIYKQAYGRLVLSLPKDVRGIAFVRQWILEQAKEKYFVMLDDDLQFQYRTPDMRIIAAPKSVKLSLFRWISKQLVRYTHCGIAFRTASYASTAMHELNSRMMHVLAYDVRAVRKSGARFTHGVSHMFTMDDFHMTLQLLERGHPNVVSLYYRSSPGPSNAKGGASEWRTIESHNTSAHTLKKLHPDFVRMRQKNNWREYEGTQYDVTVQWKKAYASSQRS